MTGIFFMKNKVLPSRTAPSHYCNDARPGGSRLVTHHRHRDMAAVKVLDDDAGPVRPGACHPSPVFICQSAEIQDDRSCCLVMNAVGTAGDAGVKSPFKRRSRFCQILAHQ